MMRLLSRKPKTVALRGVVHLPPTPVRQRPRCLARDALELRPPGDVGYGSRSSRLDLPLQLPIDGIRCHRGWSGGRPDRGDHLTSPGDGHRFTALDAPKDGGGLVLQLSYGNLRRRSHVATKVATWRFVGQAPEHQVGLGGDRVDRIGSSATPPCKRRSTRGARASWQARITADWRM